MYALPPQKSLDQGRGRSTDDDDDAGSSGQERLAIHSRYFPFSGAGAQVGEKVGCFFLTLSDEIRKKGGAPGEVRKGAREGTTRRRKKKKNAHYIGQKKMVA